MEKSDADLKKIINSKIGYTRTAVEVAYDILKYVRNIEDDQLYDQKSTTDTTPTKKNSFMDKFKQFLSTFVTPNVNAPKAGTQITNCNISENCTSTPVSSSAFKIKIKYDDFKLPRAQIQTQDGVEDYDLQIEYVRISTSGDENVCPMCAQFEGKIFRAADAPKLPLCPSCACAYDCYCKEDLPSNAVISNKEDFILPADCTPLFYKHQQKSYKETDTNKIICMCESDLKKLSEFMAPYIAAKFDAPPELACRDLLPELYMQLGKWDMAEKAINKCIEAKAYYPNDGLAELSYLTTYRKIADEVLTFLQQNPGYLQRNMYKAMGYIEEEKELLKDFLRNSKLIKKLKYNNTNQLFCNTEETI
jgi:hypothetical protein